MENQINVSEEIIKLKKDIILGRKISWIATIFLLFLLSLAATAQPTSGVSYETIESYTFLNGKDSPAYLPGIIFEFQGNKIIASTKDQTKNLYMRYNWIDTVLMIQGGLVPGKVVEAYDNGGFKCLINYMYDPVVDYYVLSIYYNNVNHIHFMKPSDQEARPDPIKMLPAGDPFIRDYTDEEVKWFWDTYRFLIWDFNSLNWLD